MSQKLIVVTGGEGFVGSHLCAQLVRAGNRVISLDNHFVKPLAPRVSGVEYRVGHTKDIAALISETPDLIFHLGEYSRVHKSVEEAGLVEDLNVVGTKAVVDYWRSTQCKLVYAGSSTKFESRDIAPYTRAKAANTELIARVGGQSALPYAITYFYNVYGPGERSWDNFGTVVETFRQNRLAGRPHTVNAPGTQTRSFTHVLDIVSALIVVGERGQGEGYTISSGEVHSIREVAEMFGGPIVMAPQTKTSRSSGADDSAKVRALGWAPAHTLKEYVAGCLQGIKKKILIFSLAYYPRHVSGAEAAVKEITDRIHDIEFYMVTLRFDARDAPEEKVGNVMVYRVGGGKLLFPLRAALKAVSLNTKHHFDAMWALMTYMTLPVVLAKIFGMRAPHIVTLQDGDPYNKVFGRARIIPFLPLVDRGFREAKVIQVISQYLATWPPMRGSSAPVELIHNGANPRDLHESVSHEQIDAVKKKFGKKEGDVWLVNTARLEHQKAQDVVVRALPMLPAHVKFLIVGGGGDEAMLKNLTQELHLQDRVMFAGHVTRDEVTAYRKASDIFVAPSRSEGLGNAFLSAMASRVPVVATREGGLAEFVSHDTAWVVPKDDSHAIAQAVEDILAHPEKVKNSTDTARAMVEREYDWDMIARQMRERVFAKVV